MNPSSITQEGVEHLLRPRVKMIADWPGNQMLLVGDVLTIYEDGKNAPLFVSSHGDKYGLTFDPSQFPHLFRKMEWHEEREPEELPRFLLHRNGSVHKVFKYHKEYACVDLSEDDEFPTSFAWLSPATEEQYNEYLKTKKP